MRERIRKFVCRGLWLCLCLIPTLFTSVWCLARNSSLYSRWLREVWQSELTSAIGWDVLVAGIAEPSPNRYRLLDVRIVDSETGVPWMRFDKIEVSRQSNRWVAVSPRGELLSDHMPELALSLHARMTRQRVQHDWSGELAIDELRMLRVSSEKSVHSVQLRLQNSEAGPRAELEFCSRSDELSRPVRITVLRDRQQSPPLTRCTIDARATPLLCSDWQPCFAPLELLGRDSVFEGWISLTLGGSSIQGVIRGQLEDVDLETLVARPFDQSLSGRASIRIHHLEWAAGRVQDVSGELLSVDGTISRTLIESLVDPTSMRWQWSERIAKSRDDEYPYEKLAVAFRANELGIVLSGKCPGRRSGVIMANSAGPILYEPASTSPIQATALIRSLTGNVNVSAALSAAGESLARVLPSPTESRSAAVRTSAEHR